MKYYFVSIQSKLRFNCSHNLNSCPDCKIPNIIRPGTRDLMNITTKNKISQMPIFKAVLQLISEKKISSS